MKKLLLSFLFLFFAGCEEKYPIYSKSYFDMAEKIDCVHIVTSYEWIKQRLHKDLARYKNAECAYILKASFHDITTCNSSFSRASEKDFTGYVTFELYEKERLLYKVQSDFKNDKEASLERITAKLKEDMLVR